MGGGNASGSNLMPQALLSLMMGGAEDVSSVEAGWI